MKKLSASKTSTYNGQVQRKRTAVFFVVGADAEPLTEAMGREGIGPETFLAWLQQGRFDAFNKVSRMIFSDRW